jgi:hypothetical protein
VSKRVSTTFITTFLLLLLARTNITIADEYALKKSPFEQMRGYKPGLTYLLSGQVRLLSEILWVKSQILRLKARPFVSKSQTFVGKSQILV